MANSSEIKAQILGAEAKILRHYIETAKNRSDINSTYVAIEHSQNKTLLAQKEFSLAEITKQHTTEKRKTLYDEEEQLISQIETLLEKNWNEFPIWDFATQRIPNFMEASIHVFPKSAVEAFLLSDDLKNAENPTVRAFVRDMTKIPSSLVSWYRGQQIGSTEYHFDIFLLTGTLLKNLCKTVFIFGFKGLMPLSPEALSRLSNYICEVPSRFLTKVSRIHQDTYSKEEISSQTIQEKGHFIYKHATSELLYDSIYSSISKTITTDFLGTLFGILTQVEFWTDPERPHLSSSLYNKFFLLGPKEITLSGEDKTKYQELIKKISEVDNPFSDISQYIAKSKIDKSENIKELLQHYPEYKTPEQQEKLLQSLVKTTHFINRLINKLGINDISPKLNSFLQQAFKTFFDTYTLTPPARIVEDIPGLVRKSDFVRSSYSIKKLAHTLDYLGLDTKKDYGLEETLSNITGSAESLEHHLASLQEEAGKLVQHDEL